MKRKYIAFVWCKGMRAFQFKTTPKRSFLKVWFKKFLEKYSKIINIIVDIIINMI